MQKTKQHHLAPFALEITEDSVTFKKPENNSDPRGAGFRDRKEIVLLLDVVFLVFPRVVIKEKKMSELNRAFLMRIFEKAVIKRKTGPTVLETLWTSLHSGPLNSVVKGVP